MSVFPIFSPLGNDPCAELRTRLGQSWVVCGLNALTRALEYEHNWQIVIATSSDLSLTQSRVSKGAGDNLVRIEISSLIDREGEHRFLLRYLLAHELGHLVFKHYEYFKLFRESGKTMKTIRRPNENPTAYEDCDLLHADFDREADGFAVVVLMRYNYLFEREEMAPGDILSLVERHYPEYNSNRHLENLQLAMDHVENNWQEVSASNLLYMTMRDIFSKHPRLNMLGDNEVSLLASTIQNE